MQCVRVQKMFFLLSNILPEEGCSTGANNINRRIGWWIIALLYISRPNTDALVYGRDSAYSEMIKQHLFPALTRLVR